MKKLLVLLCVAGLIAAGASPLFAGGIINKQNLSADYLRTMNRNAATDYADIAAYNPAGIMKMADGGYAKLDIMHFDKNYSNKVPDNFGEFDQNFGRFNSDKHSLIPGAFAIYKQKKWAGFFAFTIPAGGALVAPSTSSFKIGKHSSNTSSTRRRTYSCTRSTRMAENRGS